VGEPVPHLDAVICCTGYEYSFPFLDVKVGPECSGSTHGQLLKQQYSCMT
jgi:hypothetical protein